MSDQQERILITKIRRRQDNRADLFAKGHQWPDTVLMDLSDLAEVGIDFDALPVGVETACRFWAHVKQGKQKSNSETGARYLDVVALVPFEAQAASNPRGSSKIAEAMLDTLERIAAHLERIEKETIRQTALLDHYTRLGNRAQIRAIDRLKPEIGRAIDEAMTGDEPHDEKAGDPADSSPGSSSELDQFFPRDSNAKLDPASAAALAEHSHDDANGNAPCNADDLVEYLNVKSDGKCRGVGHIVYGMNKATSDAWPGWPNSTDQSGWNDTARQWLEWAEANL